MARLTTYSNDAVVSLTDKLIGTDADDNDLTKNYLVSDLKGFFNTNVPTPTDPTDAVNQEYVADNVVNGASISNGVLFLTRTGELADVELSNMIESTSTATQTTATVIQTLSQNEYDDLDPKDASTIYVII